jgi:hypothetical protein
MFGLCKYKNLFGEPNTGIHKTTRLFGISWSDVFTTIIGATILAYLMRWNIPRTILGMFILGIIMHRLFGVRTTLDKWLFPNVKDEC